MNKRIKDFRIKCFSKKNFKSEPSYQFSNKYCKLQDELESEIESSKLKCCKSRLYSALFQSVIGHYLKECSMIKNTNYFPLLQNNKFVFDFKEKSEIFSSHFPDQCALIPNTLALYLRHLHF